MARCLIIVWPNVSDGLGYTHQQGSKPVLPDAIAQFLVDIGAAAFADVPTPYTTGAVDIPPVVPQE